MSRSNIGDVNNRVGMISNRCWDAKYCRIYSSDGYSMEDYVEYLDDLVRGGGSIQVER